MIETAVISTRSAVLRLASICSLFNTEAAKEKRALLRLLQSRDIRATYLLKHLHTALCYIRAFPDNKNVHEESCTSLLNFGERILRLNQELVEQLRDSGIANTQVCYAFAYANASWLVKKFPQHVDIDWSSSEATEKLDTLLQLLANPAEQQIFEEQILATEDYLRHARGVHHLSEIELFFRLCRHNARAEKFIEALYDPSDIQILWHLNDCAGSRTHNRLSPDRIYYRRQGLRKISGKAALEILKPMPLTHLSRREGARVLDVVKAALLVRSREVYHMQYGSPDAVYMASCGRGIQIAFMGALPDRRFNLDVSFGYMVFANGVPIAYGGISPLFEQGNTGLNVLDEYRKGESAFIYTQVLRMGRSLFACRRFIVNPYQFGEDNMEALRSGAFWFYYRLGFRPVDKAISKLAEKEYRNITGARKYRSSIPTLKRLASCDMQLILTGSRQTGLFEEKWLGILSLGAAKLIAQQGMHHHQAVTSIMEDICRKLAIRKLQSWSKGEREQLRRFAPICGLIDNLDKWSATEKRDLVQLIRQKGAPSERDYARSMAAHRQLYAGLRRYCLRQGKEN